MTSIATAPPATAAAPTAPSTVAGIAIGGIIGVIVVAERWLPPMQALRDYTLLGVMFATIFVLGIGISFISTHRSVLKYLKMKLDDLY